MADTKFYKVTTQTDPLMLRKTCSTSAEILARIPKGTVVTQNMVLMPADGWMAVNYGTQSGFAYGQYLTPCTADGTIIQETKDNTYVPKNTTNNGDTRITEEGGTNKILIAGIATAAIGALAVLFL